MRRRRLFRTGCGVGKATDRLRHSGQVRPAGLQLLGANKLTLQSGNAGKCALDMGVEHKTVSFAYGDSVPTHCQLAGLDPAIHLTHHTKGGGAKVVGETVNVHITLLQVLLIFVLHLNVSLCRVVCVARTDAGVGANDLNAVRRGGVYQPRITAAVAGMRHLLAIERSLRGEYGSAVVRGLV